LSSIQGGRGRGKEGGRRGEGKGEGGREERRREGGRREGEERGRGDQREREREEGREMIVKICSWKAHKHTVCTVYQYYSNIVYEFVFTKREQ